MTIIIKSFWKKTPIEMTSIMENAPLQENCENYNLKPVERDDEQNILYILFHF